MVPENIFNDFSVGSFILFLFADVNGSEVRR